MLTLFYLYQEFHNVKDAGHFSFEEQPAAVADLVGQFLAVFP